MTDRAFGLDAPALARALDYLASRQCRAGGFCFYRDPHLEEPNLLDTRLALSAYAVLGRTVPRRAAILDWLAGFDPLHLPLDGLQSWSLAQRALTADRTPPEPVRARIAALTLEPPASGRDRAGWLAGTLKKIRLQALIGARHPADDLIAILRDWRRDTDDLKPSLLELVANLELSTRLGDQAPDPVAARFVASVQDARFGFRDTLDSDRAGLSVQLAGVRLCARLDLGVRHPRAILERLRASQTRDGAFAEVPGALPNLASHATALILATALASPDPLELDDAHPWIP